MQPLFEKKIFIENFPLLTLIHPNPQPLNSQNLPMMKVFCWYAPDVLNKSLLMYLWETFRGLTRLNNAFVPFSHPCQSSGSILESKGMRAIFQKKGKICENLDKNVLNLKIFWKRATSWMWLITFMKQLEYAMHI